MVEVGYNVESKILVSAECGGVVVEKDGRCVLDKDAISVITVGVVAVALPAFFIFFAIIAWVGHAVEVGEIGQRAYFVAEGAIDGLNSGAGVVNAAEGAHGYGVVGLNVEPVESEGVGVDYLGGYSVAYDPPSYVGVVVPMHDYAVGGGVVESQSGRVGA